VAKRWQCSRRSCITPAIDFDPKHRPHLEALLQPGEQLVGLCAASRQQGPFKGGAVVIGVSNRRLLIEPLDRRGEVTGEPISIEPQEIDSVKASGAGGGWVTVEAAIADHVAVRLKLKTTSGEKLNLMLMRGEGRVVGKLGGGESQRQGLEALGAWFSHIPG
jgi:hypothetical protein